MSSSVSQIRPPLPKVIGFASSTLRIGFLSAIYAAPSLTVAIWAAIHQAGTRSVVAAIFAGILIAIVFIVVTRTPRSFFLLQLPLFILSLGFVAYTLTYGMPPAHTLALLLAGTTWEEVRGFVSLSQGKWLPACFIFCTACYLLAAWGMSGRPTFRYKSIRGRKVLFALMLVTTIYLALNPAELIDGIALNPTVGSLIFLGGWVPSARDELRGSNVKKVPYHAHREGGEEVHVLVIGESVRRDSWSVYGYGRETTPYLDKLRGEAIFLQNAVADANLTEWAVPMILTGMNPEEYSIAKVRGNLVDLAKEAGYTTAWLVNQDIGISSSIGIAADRTVYPIDFQADINGRHAPDEVLLPAYAREIARRGSARFIGIHIMGSHWEYYRRYPRTFQQFGSTARLNMLSIFFGGPQTLSDVVDAYDNSIRYTDWFLHEIVERLRGLKVPATILYFPDHGEDLQLLDGAVGHGAPRYTPHAFEIPAFVWVNDAYRVAHPGRVNELIKNKALEVRSYNVFYTEAMLMGISWPGELDERSWVSDSFKPNPRIKHIAGGVLVPQP